LQIIPSGLQLPVWQAGSVENPEVSFSSSGWMFGVASSLLSFWASAWFLYERFPVLEIAFSMCYHGQTFLSSL
jgi:hypothetical protein